jgi:hypothetical protein
MGPSEPSQTPVLNQKSREMADSSAESLFAYMDMEPEGFPVL